MQAVILTAGEGTRMRPLTYTTQKNMILINGKPGLEYSLDFLPEEITEVIFVINYLGDQIKEHFGNEYKGRKIEYVTQKELNGTGGAVYAAKDLIKEKFLVMNGDDLYHKKDLEKLLRYDVAILGYEVEDIGRFGVIKTNERGDMVEILEAPHANNDYRLANIGVYSLNQKFFDYPLVSKNPGDKEYGLPQTLALMAKDFEVKVVKAEFWLPIGNPEDIQIAEKELPKFLE